MYLTNKERRLRSWETLLIFCFGTQSKKYSNTIWSNLVDCHMYPCAVISFEIRNSICPTGNLMKTQLAPKWGGKVPIPPCWGREAPENQEVNISKGWKNLWNWIDAVGVCLSHFTAAIRTAERQLSDQLSCLEEAQSCLAFRKTD